MKGKDWEAEYPIHSLGIGNLDSCVFFFSRVFSDIMKDEGS